MFREIGLVCNAAGDFHFEIDKIRNWRNQFRLHAKQDMSMHLTATLK